MRRPIAASPMWCSSACRWRISATAFRNSRSRSIRPVGGLETHGPRGHADPRHDRIRLRDRRPSCRCSGPGNSAPENRHVGACAVRRRGVARRPAGGCARTSSASRSWSPGSATICAPATASVQAGRRDRDQDHLSGRPGRSPASTAASAHLVSQVDGRPAFGGTPSDDSVAHLIAELKARGLKVTLYPFLMMDIAGRQRAAPIRRPARPRSRPIPGAAASPAIRRRASPARRTGRARRRRRSMRSSASAIRTAGTIAAWCCTTRSSRPTPAASMRS